LYAWRNLRRNRGYAFINIAGLSAGLAITLLIGLWIADEFSFDHYHTHHARIAQVMLRQEAADRTKGQAGHPWVHVNSFISTVLGPTLRKGYDDVFTKTAMISPPYWHLIGTSDKDGNQSVSKQGPWAQASFADIFSLHMLAGTAASLNDPSNILLGRSTARALFGLANPIGKIVKLDNKTPFAVGGVFDDLPFNSSFHVVQFLLPWDHPNNSYLNANTDWQDHSGKMYVQLAGNTTADQATQRIKTLMPSPGHLSHQEFMVYPFDRLHLHGEFKEGAPSGGRIQFVWLFAIIGAFVLLLACINFMNLSTARSEQRAKEVGIRKTIGSRRYQLIGQFLGESLLTAILAFAGAIVIAALCLPFFNDLSAKEMSFPWNSLPFWACAIAFTGLTGLVAGSYPAFYLSSFRPVKVLRGTARFGTSPERGTTLWAKFVKAGRGASLPRKILVVTQFSVSLSLIICTIVVYRQIEFAKDRPIGYNRDGLITVPINTPDLADHYDALRTALFNTGVITDMARSSQPTTQFDNGNDLRWEGQTEEQRQVSYHNVNVTPEFGATIGWQILQGRDFSRDFTTDSNSAILNAAAVQRAGLKDPVGMRVTLFGKPYQVIGVAANLLTNSPYEAMEPSIFLGDGHTNFITIRLKPGTPIRTALSAIEPLFRRFNPASPFNYTFNDEEYAQKFVTETRIGSLATVFAGLAVLISCLGLFGLASFVAEQRTKEIGVRKVLGAGVLNLWALLSGDFIKLVALSMLIAMPLAYYAMNRWLQNYTLHTALTGWIFVAAGAGILLLTLVTVSFQSLKAAFANPIKSLRTE
jgi:ABC-type antimicrobial peptide transport system permease subunit